MSPHPNPLPKGEGAGTVPCSGAELGCDRVDAKPVYRNKLGSWYDAVFRCRSEL
jgi:hypothetical protein